MLDIIQFHDSPELIFQWILRDCYIDFKKYGNTYFVRRSNYDGRPPSPIFRLDGKQMLRFVKRHGDKKCDTLN